MRLRREIRLSVPDARSPHVRARIAKQMRALDATEEEEATRWIESVSEFDSEIR